MYEIRRLFISGTLEGLTYTEKTSVYMPVGFVCENPCCNTSGYKIISCVKL